MEKFKVIGKEIVERLAPLRKNCITFLKDILKEFNGVISLVNSDNEFVDNDVVSCTYDGGNHPEYAANPFSIIYRVKSFGDDDIRLDIEDTDDYPLENISTLELYYLCLYISDNKEELKDIARNTSCNNLSKK